MISVLKEFFKKNASKDTEESKEEKLQQACAALLIEVMRADYEQNEEETEKISALLQNTFKLSDAQLKKLMTFSEQAGRETTSVHPFTSLINEHYEYDERVHLIELMWKVAYADGNLDKYEDNIIRKVSDLLYIRHSDFIKAKLAEKP